MRPLPLQREQDQSLERALYAFAEGIGIDVDAVSSTVARSAEGPTNPELGIRACGPLRRAYGTTTNVLCPRSGPYLAFDRLPKPGQTYQVYRPAVSRCVVPP
jgi:hypothetical protein